MVWARRAAGWVGAAGLVLAGCVAVPAPVELGAYLDPAGLERRRPAEREAFTLIWVAGPERQAVLPKVLDLYVRFQDAPVVLWWVQREAEPPQPGLPFALVQDPNGRFTERVGGAPTALLLDAYGRIIYRTSPGATVPIEDVERALRIALDRRESDENTSTRPARRMPVAYACGPL